MTSDTELPDVEEGSSVTKETSNLAQLASTDVAMLQHQTLLKVEVCIQEDVPQGRQEQVLLALQVVGDRAEVDI